MHPKLLPCYEAVSPDVSLSLSISEVQVLKYLSKWPIDSSLWVAVKELKQRCHTADGGNLAPP